MYSVIGHSIKSTHTENFSIYSVMDTPGDKGQGIGPEVWSDFDLNPNGPVPLRVFPAGCLASRGPLWPSALANGHQTNSAPAEQKPPGGNQRRLAGTKEDSQAEGLAARVGLLRGGVRTFGML